MRILELLAPRRPVVAGANPSAWLAPPPDPTHGVPLPFVCADGRGRASLDLLDRARVTQCALSRICGVCGGGLERRVAFVGTAEEDARNAFHFPPTHESCAETLVADLREHGVPVPGQDAGEPTTVTCAAFEFVRPATGDLDRRPVFAPVR